MECDSIYVGVSDDVSVCLSTSPHNLSLASSSHHVWSRDSSKHHVTSPDRSTTLVSSRHDASNGSYHKKEKDAPPRNGAVKAATPQEGGGRTSSAFFIPLSEKQEGDAGNEQINLTKISHNG